MAGRKEEQLYKGERLWVKRVNRT